MRKKQSSFILDLLAQAKSSYKQTLERLSNTSRSMKIVDGGNNQNDNTRIGIHQKVFKKIDCLDCGNCCMTTPAIVLPKDIKPIAKFLGISKKQLERKYLMDDLTGDIVFNKVPCTFLGDDYKCSIYEVRPEACRRFPHTDESNFYNIPKWNAKNTMVCPAAFLVTEELYKLSR